MGKKTPLVIALIGAAALTIGITINNAKKFVGYLTYNLNYFKVHSISLKGILCKASFGLNNPTKTAISLKDYKVEVYYLNPDKTKTLIASSPVNQLAIPANQSINITTDITVSIIGATKLVRDLTAKILQGKIAELTTIIQQEIKANTVIVLKATVAGQYVEKEFSAK